MVLTDELPRPIVTRAEARASGLRRYFTGVPCKHGHVAERAVVSKSCVACLSVADEARRQRPEQKAKAKERSRNHYAANRDAVLARGRQRAQSGYNRRYYEENKEAFIAGVKDWIKRNPERRKVYRNNRRAAEGRVSKTEVDHIRAAQKAKCAICRVGLSKAGEHIDHIVPLSRGGANISANIQLLCPTCNYRKGSKDPIDFMQQLGKLL